MLKTRTLVVAIVLVLAGLQMAFCNSSRVTLKKQSGEIVQMFARPGSGSDAFAGFPSGTACTKLDGPTRFVLSDGHTSDYYKLDCNGTTGYVNVKFVD